MKIKKIIPHLIYIFLITILVFNLKKKEAKCPELIKPKTKSTFWTFGVNYSELTPLESNKKLSKFVNKIEKIVSKNDWESFIKNIEKEHYEEQIPELDYSRERMILNDLEVYSYQVDHISFINRIPDIDHNTEFSKLDQIKRINLIGINEKENYGDNILCVYGYIELNNQLIYAVTMMFTEVNGEYKITGPVG